MNYNELINKINEVYDGGFYDGNVYDFKKFTERRLLWKTLGNMVDKKMKEYFYFFGQKEKQDE